MDTNNNQLRLANETPTPQLTSSSAEASSGAWLVTVNGSDFVAGTQAIFNGIAKTATVVDPTRLTLLLSSAELDQGGVLHVVNPAPGGGASNQLLMASRKAQSIQFVAPIDPVIGAAPIALYANSSVDLPITFVTSTPQVCTVGETVDGWFVTVLALGGCRITALQSGNGEYLPSQSGEMGFTIHATPQPLKLVYLPLVSR